MRLHRILVVAALVALAVAPATSARSMLTKDQAFVRASRCLKNHGAHDVLARGFNLGGMAQYGGTTRGTAAWQYVVRGDQAVGVKLWFAGSTGPTKLEKKWAQTCVTWGVPLVR